MNYLRNKRVHFVVLFITLLQFSAGILSRSYDDNTFSRSVIIPPAYTFGIWALISVMAVIYGVYQLLPGRQNQLMHYRLSRLLIVIYFLLLGWLVAGDLNWRVSALLISIAVFALLTVAMREILGSGTELRFTYAEKVVLEGQIAVFTASWVFFMIENAAAVLERFDVWQAHSVMTAIWYELLLAIAAIICVFFGMKFRYNSFYMATALLTFAVMCWGVWQRVSG